MSVPLHLVTVSDKPYLVRLAQLQLKPLPASLEPSTDLLSHQSSYDDDLVLEAKSQQIPKKNSQQQVMLYIS